MSIISLIEVLIMMAVMVYVQACGCLLVQITFIANFSILFLLFHSCYYINFCYSNEREVTAKSAWICNCKLGP